MSNSNRSEAQIYFFATSHKIEAAAAIFESRLEAIMLEINILG